MKRSAFGDLLLAAWLAVSPAMAQSVASGTFVADPRNGCKVWNPHPVADETATWNGECVNGVAHGRGTLQWTRGGRITETDDGEWNEGRQFGRGKQNWGSGSYQGDFVNGEPSGQGVMILLRARYEGEFRSGKPNGTGTVTNLDGVFRGQWKDGCLTDGTRRIAFAVSLSTCH